ncbi:MAG TPA: twin-arginine translocase subunit TatC [Actinomycetota bacterium]|nr:twin-arginine translocase subunit TatC [Actinomycetota bacterium]
MAVIPFRRRRSESEHSGTMTLMEHLEELRHRLIVILLALAFGSIPAWFVYEPIKDALSEPYCDFIARNPQFNPLSDGRCGLFFSGPVDGFTVKLKIVLYLGLAIALPVVLYQLWAFVTPGLTKREKAYAIPFIATSLALFAGGAAFAYLALPRGLEFLLGFAGEGTFAILHFDRYIGFVVLVILAFGFSFLLPVLLVFLELVGVLTPERLGAWRRYAIVAIAVFAAVITPTGDPITLLMLGVPMYVFYEAAIIVGRVTRRRRAAEET